MSQKEKIIVRHVKNGDTFVGYPPNNLSRNLEKHFSLINVSAPKEGIDPEGYEKAKEALRGFICKDGEEIIIQRDGVNNYGWDMVHVTTQDGTDVNAEMKKFIQEIRNK